MGGDAQPQILLQVAARLFHYGQSPAAAVSAGRWALQGPATGFDTWTSGEAPTVTVEGHAPDDWMADARRTWAQGRKQAAVRQRIRPRSRNPASTTTGSAPGRRIHERWSVAPAASDSTISVMRVDSNFFCTVPMPDAGDPSVAATARRFGNDAVIECYKNLVDWARTADDAGLRHDVADRAPLPVRGLRGPAQPDPVRTAPGRC